MITVILAAMAMAIAGLALALAEATGAPKDRRRRPAAVAAHIAQIAVPIALFAAAIWGEAQTFAIVMAAGWVAGALVGTIWSVVRWGRVSDSGTVTA